MATKAKAKKAAYKVPYAPDGSLLNYINAYAIGGLPEKESHWDAATKMWRDVPIDWREPAPFHAVLQLTKVEHGRGRLTVWWKDVITGATFPMTGSEFNRLITEAEWQGPLLIDGLWRPVKRGANYNVEHVPAEEA